MKFSVSSRVGQAQEHLIFCSLARCMPCSKTWTPRKERPRQPQLKSIALGHWINHGKAMYNFGIPGVRSNLPDIYWSQWWVEWGWEVKRCMLASTWGKPLRAPPLQGQGSYLGVRKMHGSIWERSTIWGDAVEGNHHIKSLSRVFWTPVTPPTGFCLMSSVSSRWFSD